MSEATIQTALQTLIQSLSAFDDADVVINDWSLLDSGVNAAPYFIFESADDFSSVQTAKVEQTTYQIKGYLFENFTTWKATLDNLTTRRDALLTLFNDSDTGARMAGSVDASSKAVNIEEIRAGSGVQPWYYHYISAEEAANATPQYLWQLLIFTAREG